MLSAIERFDPDLAKQLRRASSSVTVHVAVAWGYIESADEKMLDEIERVIATLIRLIV